MRTILRTLVLAAALCLWGSTLKAQTTIFSESFLNGDKTDIITEGGSKIDGYTSPIKNCADERGLRTPGVGGNNPALIILPAQKFNKANPFIRLSFNIFVFDANLKCKSAKDFPTATYVKVYLVKSSKTETSKKPEANEVYASGEFELKNANGKNTITFTDKQTAGMKEGDGYRVVLDFKAPEGGGPQGNTKYLLDDFVLEKDVCTESGCAPYANNDYFMFGEGGFMGTTLKANVYGGFEPWENDPRVKDFRVKSLEVALAPNGGQDGVKRGTGLDDMEFILVTPLAVDIKSCISQTVNAGTLKFNSNGTFTFTKGDACVLRVSFTYKIKDRNGYFSNNAKVTIDLGEQIILPVTYKSFTATRSSKSGVMLEWETAMEEGNRGFHVQRNIDGNWKNVAFVFSQAEGGNSSAVLKYAYKDANSSIGISQYRILQVDMDGKGRYSEVRSVRGEAMAAKVSIFPNPSNTGSFNILFEDGAAVRDVVVMDVSGRTVKQFKSVSANSLSVSALNDGFYTVQVINRSTGVITAEKVIIKKR